MRVDESVVTRFYLHGASRPYDDRAHDNRRVRSEQRVADRRAIDRRDGVN